MNPESNQQKKPHGLSAFSVCKNPLSLDYAVVEMINSCLPVADEVVIGEMGSTDGSREMLDEWSEREPRIRIVDIKDWTLCRGDMKWFTNSLNDCRQHLKYSMMLELDMDEVLSDHPETHAAVRHAVAHTNAYAFNRLNFVTANQLIPEGECCGKWVTRIGPSHLFMPSDEPHSRGEIHLLDMATLNPAGVIYHLGFLRERSAFFAKAKVVLGAFFNEYDTRLATAEQEGTHPFEKFPWWNRLVPYNGYYPEAVKKWMEARGYIL